MFQQNVWMSQCFINATKNSTKNQHFQPTLKHKMVLFHISYIKLDFRVLESTES